MPEAKRRENLKISTVSTITERTRKMRTEKRSSGQLKGLSVGVDLNGFSR